MSVSYFVRYEGNSEDLPSFLRYYRESHVPILARFPGIQRVTLHTAVPWNDAFPVNRGSAVLIAQLEFASEADLESAFRSPARAEARRDVHGFHFQGTMTHQAMKSEEVWRRP